MASVRRMYVLQALGETEPGEQAGGPADATPLALPLTGADSEVSLPRAAIVRGVWGGVNRCTPACFSSPTRPTESSALNTILLIRKEKANLWDT